MREVTVEVRQEDIEHGVAGDGARCAVAIALNRATGGRWEVHPYSVYAILPGVEMGILPAEAECFIKALDQGQAVAPLTFTVRLSYGGGR